MLLASNPTHGCRTLGLVARWRDPEGSRNVGAEGFGFALGVQTLPADCGDCVFLADFLNALAFDVGAANFKHPALVKAYGEVETERASRTRVCGALKWSHVHHPGHQTDKSWYTTLNRVADNLAGRGAELDVQVPLALLATLADQKPKTPKIDALKPYLTELAAISDAQTALDEASLGMGLDQRPAALVTSPGPPGE